MIKNIAKIVYGWIKCIVSSYQRKSYSPAYRLVEINLTETDEYIITAQLINKNSIFQAKPEEILSKDHLVDQFSPRDIRALTYLGYLMIK